MTRYLDQFKRPVFRVRDWQRIYEKSDAKRMNADKPLDWVAVPTKHDGTGYKRLMRSKSWNGMLMHSAFVLIIQVAAKMPVRGTLRNHDGALNASDLADKTDGNADVFSEALEVLSNPEFGIRWLEVSEDTSEYPRVGAPTDRTGQDTQDKTLPNATASGRARRSKPAAKPAPNGDHATFIEHFCAHWETQYGAKYHMLAKDGVAAAKVLKLAGSLDDAKALADRYLATHDRYLDEQKHPLPLLLNQINRFRSTVTAGSYRNGNGLTDLDTIHKPSPELRAIAAEIQEERN